MDTEEDMIVLVVMDEEDGLNSSEISQENYPDVNDIMETAVKHGQFIEIKQEAMEDTEYLDEIEATEDIIKQEEDSMSYYEDDPFDFDYYPNSDTIKIENHSTTNKRRINMLKPWERQSFVDDLRNQYTELCDNQELLVDTLVQVMMNVTPPPPPRDFYIMNGIMMECVECGRLSETQGEAKRHYQNYHGERYLICFACGVDFRRATNLYKHEIRCVAPDAHIVLQARGKYVGSKGRSRPYLALNQHRLADTLKPTSFPCGLCSAVFTSRLTLQAHDNLHRGVRPHRCTTCTAAYTSKPALMRHMKTAHSNVQYICECCSRPFKLKAALNAHMETHKPYRRHLCGECGKRFAQSTALRLHVRREHRRLPPPCACQICPKRYPRMYLLKAHMKKAHGMSIMTRKMFFKALPKMTELEVQNCKIILKDEKA